MADWPYVDMLLIFRQPASRCYILILFRKSTVTYAGLFFGFAPGVRYRRLASRQAVAVSATALDAEFICESFRRDAIGSAHGGAGRCGFRRDVLNSHH